MKHSINFSADVIRARVKALSALQTMIDGRERVPLNTDANPALNQLIVFAFSRALAQIVQHVTDYTIDPKDFYSNPVDLLMLEATIEVNNSTDIKWPIVVSAVEDYIANRVMAEILPDAHSAISLYLDMADNAISVLRDILDVGTSSIRLQRSY